MKKLQTITTSTAIALASVGAPVFAQEAQATSVPADTAVNEPALVTKSQVKPLEKSEVPAPSTVKHALDAQKAVVKDAEAKIDTAKADVKEKEATVASIETEYSNADKAVNDAEAIASQVTPAKVAQVKDAQAKNLEAQTANQEATEATNAQIKTETAVLAEKQSDVATAKENLDQAEKDVQTAEATVANAESALDGTGLTNAEKDLKEAQKGVKDAETTVSDAQTAFKNATKADADRNQAIKSAETDVNTKNDAVKLAKEKLTTANQHAESVDAKLEDAQTELTKAQDALDNVDIVKIADLTQFKKDKAEGDSDFMTDSGATVIENSSTKISKADKKRTVDLDNLTDEQKLAVSELYVKGLKQIRKELNGLSETEVTDKALELATKRAEQYKERGLNPLSHGHIGAGVENLVRIGSKERVSNLYELKQVVYNALMNTSFADAPSKWGHLSANLRFAKYIGLDIANINGDYWLVIAFSNEGTPIEDKTDIATLEKAVATAESNLGQAKTASENAKNALTTASTDYASALSLKTEAEKVLADTMATPLQAQVAENNLRLAEIALENAKKREAKASEAVANFSASLADKKVALEKAQAELEEVKVVQKSASQALENATAQLRAQEAKVNSLKEQSDKLLAEKDALVKEAKKLAEQLQAYLDAPVALANAQDTQAKAEAKLAQAKAELTTAQSTLEDLLSAYRTEYAKLVDLQTDYDELVDLAEKAQENVVATLPDGTVIAVPKVAPTAEVLPELNLEELAKEDAKDSVVKQLPDGTTVAVPKDAPIAETLPTVNVDELKKALDAGKEVTVDAQGNVVVRATKPATDEKPGTVDRPQANNEKSNKVYASDKNVITDNKGNVIVKGQTYTSQQQVSSKLTYSRVERAKTLPDTGESSSVAMLVLGAILGTFGLVTVRRKN